MSRLCHVGLERARFLSTTVLKNEGANLLGNLQKASKKKENGTDRSLIGASSYKRAVQTTVKSLPVTKVCREKRVEIPLPQGAVGRHH